MPLLSLTPAKVTPVGGDRRSLSASFLQQIEFLRVCEVTCSLVDQPPNQSQRLELVYRIDIFLFRQINRIPTNQQDNRRHRHHRRQRSVRDDQELLRKRPDLTITKSFAECSELRDQLLLLWQTTSAASTPCGASLELNAYLLFGVRQPNVLVKLLTNSRHNWLIEARRRVLESFLNRLVQLVQQTTDSTAVHDSRCQCDQVPVLVDAFFQKN